MLLYALNHLETLITLLTYIRKEHLNCCTNYEGYMRMTDNHDEGISKLEYHVLTAMAGEPLYGYAIKQAVETESEGTLNPRAGSLYRVLARMVTRGLVTESDPAEDASPHPGRTRRYYGLTAEGRTALSAEARRLRGAAALAEERLKVAQSRP